MKPVRAKRESERGDLLTQKAFVWPNFAYSVGRVRTVLGEKWRWQGR